MPNRNTRPRLVLFSDFQFDLDTYELIRHGIRVRLPEQPCRVLSLLVGRPGELVTRQELCREIWGQDTFVDFEHGLNNCIKQIRATLGDDSEIPRYIETIPKRGYRFLAAVETPGEEIAQPSANSISASPSDAAAGPDWRSRFSFRVFLALVAAVLVVAFGAWRISRSKIERTQIKSIAVLPLANLSGDPAQDYFADGMTEELTTDLGQISALRVISRTSAMHYKGTNKTLPEIARELHVDAVIEGSVERSGERVRITAQLVEASTDRHLWARRYERDLRDVLRLQNEVAEQIATEIRIKLSPQEQIQLANARPVNPRAHEADLRGFYEFRVHTPAELYVAGRGESIEKAIQYFQQALALDPNDALAYAGLADAYYDQSTYLRAPLEVMPKAKAAAARAIELDETLAEAHASLGYVKLTFDWDWPGAEREFHRALELNPNLPRAHAGYSHYLVSLRRTDEAILELDRLQKIDPFFPQPHMGLPFMLFNARRYQAAIESAETNGDDRVRALSLSELGRPEEAIAAANRAVKSAQSPVILAQVASAYAMAGRKDTARTMLSAIEAQARQRYICGFNVACVYAPLGDNERAFAWLEKAFIARSD